MLKISIGKKISIILIIFILIYISITSVLVFNTMKSRTMNMQQQLSIQFTEQQYKNAQLYLQSLEATTKLVLNHHGLVDRLQNQLIHDETIPVLLDGLRSSNLDISSIIVYGVNNAIYSTSNISSIKSLESLKEDSYFANFLASSTLSEWSIQNPKKLVTIPIDPRNILLHSEKILDKEGQIAGLMILETKTSRFYEFFQAGDPTISSSSKVALLFNDGHELMFGEHLRMDALSLSNMFIHQPQPDKTFNTYETELGNLLVYNIYKSNDKVIITINTDQWEKQLNVVKFTLLLVNLIIAVVFIYIIMLLTKSIYDPIHKLHRQMDESTKEL